jgi:2-polyprenyl-3-methyl-5-hydroxy-6-metoxy-1,4-benzoquinol methylase
MGIRTGDEAFASLEPIMTKYGAAGSPQSFFETVNKIFHDAEAAVYDAVHKDMWENLPWVIENLVDDVQISARPLHNIRLLDIGCGTGLASELFLRTKLGGEVAAVTLVDTSSNMLSKAQSRADKWHGVQTAFHLGTIADAKRLQPFDVVLASSVLHHVPDLPQFFRELAAVVKNKGLFIHCQDPNADADPSVQLRRSNEARQPARESVARSRGKRLLRTLGLIDAVRTSRRVLSFSKHREPDYIDQTNHVLLGERVIARPMSATDLWAVTDIHIGEEKGISIRQMRAILSSFECLSVRSYQFFGDQPVADLQSRERALFATRDLNGGLVAAVWQKC